MSKGYVEGKKFAIAKNRNPIYRWTIRTVFPKITDLFRFPLLLTQVLKLTQNIFFTSATPCRLGGGYQCCGRI